LRAVQCCPDHDSDAGLTWWTLAAAWTPDHD
jgi:hypothetical protein